MSTNISGEKREALLSKIAEIKTFIEKNGEDKNALQLLSYLGDLSREVNGKKYGLVFEEHREKIDELLDENAPVFTEEKKLFVDNGGELNFFLEGDNLASLKLLEKTHRGKIDVITLIRRIIRETVLYMMTKSLMKTIISSIVNMHHLYMKD